jgi:hypothetical protein
VSISVIAHGAVFAVLARMPLIRIQRVATPVAAAPAAASESAEDTVEVAIVRVPDAPVPAAATASATAAVSSTATASGSATAPASVTAPATASVSTSSASTLLHMRSAASAARPGAEPSAAGSPSTSPGPDLGGHGGSILEAIANRPDAPTPPAPIKPSGSLQPNGGGTARIDDVVTTVTVERDGTAHFHDKADIDIHFHLPSLDVFRDPGKSWEEAKQGLGAALRQWIADPYGFHGPEPEARVAEARAGSPTEMPEHLQAVPGQCDQVGALNCDPEPLPPPRTLVEGHFDLNAYLMRKFHAGDPYESRKRALLDKTFDERVQAGAAFRTEQLDRAAELMRRNLEQLWLRVRDPAQRRDALFAMWDECAEGDGPLGEAGQRARAQVIGWIAVHLPRGGPDAYTAVELAQLAKHRQSTQAFEPY